MSAEPDLAVNRGEPQAQAGSQWQTVEAVRTVLIVVHNVTATTRLLDVLPLIATDQRIQVVFSITGSSAFTDGTEQFLADQGIMPVTWSRLTSLNLDLAISASYGGNLRGLGIPIIVIPHGMGYNKYLAQGNRETGKQGNRETGKQGNRETGKQGNRETGKQGKTVFGLSPEWLVEDGELIPAAVVLVSPGATRSPARREPRSGRSGSSGRRSVFRSDAREPAAALGLPASARRSCWSTAGGGVIDVGWVVADGSGSRPGAATRGSTAAGRIPRRSRPASQYLVLAFALAGTNVAGRLRSGGECACCHRRKDGEPRWSPPIWCWVITGR